ncbi:MAG: MATE family efflux transporter [Synergistaceae bacterium]|jgi:putative MATE family efflux protein|nr:MATE family efflux transporter [Synergistaceae bacterium]
MIVFIMSNIDGFDAKYEKMTTAPVERLVLRLAVPTITIMLISALYNMADTYFVGSLGTSAVAGVGVAFPLMNVIQAVGYFFGQGTGNYVSRQFGAMKLEDASKMVATGFFTTLTVGVALAAAGIVFLDALAVSLGATLTILPYAKGYIFYILLGIPWMTASIMLNTLLRFQGSASYAMVGMVSGAVINVVLDPILIYVCKMGVSGAALATMISQFISFCLLLSGCAKSGNIHVVPRNFTLRPALFKDMVRGGAPSLFRQALASIATIFINRLSGNYGDAAIAAMSIVMRIMIIASSALIGLGQGFQPVCGFNYGAGCYGRVKQAFRFCVKLSVSGLLVTTAAAWLFAPDIMAVFRDDPEVIRIGSLALRLQFLTSPLMGWIIMNNMMFQTIGKSLPASTLALARQGLFLLPILYVLSHSLGLPGIQASQPLADAATFALSIPFNIRVMRGMKQ